MTAATRHGWRDVDRRTRFRVAALVLVLAVGGAVVWLAVRNGTTSGAPSASLHPSAVSAAQVESLAASAGHPVFWLGPRAGTTYELSQESNGTIYLRYLPAGVAVGSSQPYLTVATYPFSGAYAALRAVARQSGSTPLKVAGGGLAVVSASHPESVHIAYPGLDYQVEVYDPAPGRATALVAGGQLAAVGGLHAASTASAQPRALSAASIQALARTLAHPLYWLGPRQGYRYEVTQTSNGQVYIRYLPRGVAVGTSREYLTVGTYPFPGALKAIRALGRQKGASTLELAGGGLAVLGPQYPKSVHLAFPGSDYEVEVFDPSPAAARSLVSSGRVAAVR